MEVHRAGIHRFHEAVEKMPDLLDALLAAPAHRVVDHPEVSNMPGIYLFSEDDRPVYVGQSRKLRQRLRQHTHQASGHNSASFAFLIARREASDAGVNVARFRKVLEGDPDFAAHFTRAKTRVGAMLVRFIELLDPVERTLFEVYASLALDTGEFNKFETH